MNRGAEMIARSMPELMTWIGRREVVEDEISLTAVRRIAAMLDLEPRRFVAGSPLPPHWFTLSFHNNAMQRDIGPDGHAKRASSCPQFPCPAAWGRAATRRSWAASSPAGRQGALPRWSASRPGSPAPGASSY
jgi:3-methylfumaryl-CoA hydratase